MRGESVIDPRVKVADLVIDFTVIASRAPCVTWFGLGGDRILRGKGGADDAAKAQRNVRTAGTPNDPRSPGRWRTRKEKETEKD